MDNQEHIAARPNFLRRGPGLLDSLYNIWCAAAEKFGIAKSDADTTPEAAPYKLETSRERHYN